MNVAGEGLYRLAPPKGLFVFTVGSLSPVSVSGGAVSDVDFPAIRLSESTSCHQERYQDKPEVEESHVCCLNTVLRGEYFARQLGHYTPQVG